MNSIFALVALSIAPGIFLSVVIYGKDKYDKEPKRILLAAFLLGGFSTIPAAIFESILMPHFGQERLTLVQYAIQAFLMVGLVEESCKFFALRLHAYRLPDFNEPFDGIVYAAFVALGFATAENLMYVLAGGFRTGLVRMFTAVPAHFAFGVIMGYYAGLGKFAPRYRTIYLLQGLLYAAFIHGAYDFFILQKNIPMLAFLTSVILVIAIRMARKAIRELQANSVFRFNNRYLGLEEDKHEENYN